MRGVLIGSLRGLGLLSCRPTSPEIGNLADSSLLSDVLDVKADWLAWIAQETETRLAWASFEYDCSLCTLTSRRGVVDLSELPSKLPSSDCLWEAPSADAWLALRTRLGSVSLGPSLSSLLHGLVNGTHMSEHISSWSKRLCGQVLGRLLWDLRQIEILSKSDFFCLPSLSSGQQQSKASLLRGLDYLLTTLNNPTSTSDLVSYK